MLSSHYLLFSGAKVGTLFHHTDCQAVGQLVLQQHFVVFGLSSLVVAGSGAVLVASAPAGPGPGGGPAGQGGDQVCQETADLAEREVDEAAARAYLYRLGHHKWFRMSY